MSLDSYKLRVVHLTAIWAFGVGQPVLSLVDGNPDLLVTRGVTRLDVVLLVLVVMLVPPLAAVGYAWVAGRFSRWVGDVVYLVLVGLFLIPIALQVAKRLEPSLGLALLLVCAISVGGVFVYVRVRVVRIFVGFSVVLPALGLLWFVHGMPNLTSDAEAARVRVASPHPVVFLVLDEFPLESLMTRAGRIDEVRFPAFARLARDGAWYRNATTPYGGTSEAVPAILTGRLSDSGGSPVAADSRNVFTLLAGGYELHVHEAATRLCPPHLCERSGSSFAERFTGLFSDIREAYMTRIVPRSASHYIHVVEFESVMQKESTRSLEAFDQMLAEIRAGTSDRSLYFAHVYLPHAPWRFLPSGKQYPFRGIDGWSTGDYWRDAAWPVLLGQQRHLLQVEYTDRLLGRLLDVLDRKGIYDGALVAVVADHGASFVSGGPRRLVVRANVADIASVPMFVKYPGGARRGVDDRFARTVDLIPTIADVLGIGLPWEVDGGSLLSDSSRSGPVVVRGGGHAVAARIGDILRERDAAVRRKSAVFGEGRASLYRIGVHKALLGTRVDPLVAPSRTVRIRIDGGSRVTVDTSSDVLPVRVSGIVTDGVISTGVELAIALNGRIAALTRVWAEGEGQRFGALVPESSLRDGVNRIDVFAVSGSGRRVVLTHL